MRSSVIGRAFFLAALFTFSAQAESISAELRWLQPLPHGNDLENIAFLDESTAIVVGSAGTVMVTRDAGFTWSVSFEEVFAGQPIRPALGIVARVDALTAIAGDGFLRTTDAGHTWDLLPVVAADDIDFADGVGIVVSRSASGDGILRSVDGGQSWTSIFATTDVGAVDVLTSALIVAVGNVFMRSEDGGDTWTTLPFPNTPGVPSSISFVDAMNGAVTDGTDRIYVTSDGGVTWLERALDPVYSDSGTYGARVLMLDAQTILVAARHTACDPITSQCSHMGQFLRSSDGGVSWESDFGTRAFRSLARNISGLVLLAGDGGVVYRWTEADGMEQVAGSQYAATDGGGRSAFANSDHGMVLGNESSLTLSGASTTVLRTSNGGDTWNAIKLWSTNLTDVAATPGGAYAVGSRMESGIPRKTLLKSVDGGASWTSLWSAPTNYGTEGLQAIAFGSSTHGVAVGKRNALIVIDNDVVTAGTVLPGIGLSLSDVAMGDASTAVAVGSTGTQKRIFRSVNGGSTWTETTPPIQSSLMYAVAFASPQVCVVGGSGFRFFRSEDGGATWSTAFIDGSTTYEIRSLAFASPTHGLAAGTTIGGGALLETFDAGETWAALEHPTGNPLTGIAWLDPFRAIVSGEGLEILEYSNQPLPTLISSFTAVGEPFAATLRWSVHDGSTPSMFEVHRRDGDVSRPVARDLPAGARAYRDEGVVAGTTYEYTLVVLDEDGSMTTSAPVRVTIPGAALELLPNQPNPFNPSTTLRFILPARGPVRLVVYDIAGRRVVTLVDEVRDAGLQTVQWNGMNARGEPVASGVYVSRLEAGKSAVSRKLVLIK